MLESELPVIPVSGGVLIHVKAFPGSKHNGIEGIQDGALKVYVTQIAEKGKANDALRQVLVKSLKLKNSQVELICGETSRMKKFLLKDGGSVSAAESLQSFVNSLR
ncbi:MAG: DUF167 domain-containing protein [Planctomycetaceae bacterium]|jgi:uncharacterized protein (TIGR00251 family)|nr:DUF167 domain-containing protein [Planctomycetaceae bacterium]